VASNSAHNCPVSSWFLKHLCGQADRQGVDVVVSAGHRPGSENLGLGLALGFV